VYFIILLIIYVLYHTEETVFLISQFEFWPVMVDQCAIHSST